MRRMIAAILMVGMSYSAQAQTAEEAVAYIMFHVEDNIKIPSALNSLDGFVKQTSKSPASYTLNVVQNGKYQGDLLFDVKKETDCVYVAATTVVIDGKTAHSDKIRVDFSNNIEVDVLSDMTEKPIVLRSIDKCAFKGIERTNNGTKVDDECRTSSVSTLFSGNIERVNKAFAFLRSSFCKGRAF